MEFNKPPEFGKRFTLPEYMPMNWSSPIIEASIQFATVMVERYDNFVIDQILKEARRAGISDITVLNKFVILQALQKCVPMKAKGNASGGECPRCHAVIAHHDSYCHHCGQALKWKED